MMCEFWAGATFANKGYCPYRLTEAGILTAAEVHVAAALSPRPHTVWLMGLSCCRHSTSPATRILVFVVLASTSSEFQSPRVRTDGRVDASGHLERHRTTTPTTSESATKIGSWHVRVLDIYDEAGTKRFDLGGDWTPALHIIPGAGKKHIRSPEPRPSRSRTSTPTTSTTENGVLQIGTWVATPQ